MRQTGLNLIAISIFCITLSILLGPMLNISPTIPAVTTFVVMGFITVDTLAWQNQGINLVLDVFTSSEERQRVVYHEAGHFLAAYLLDIPITGYTLTAWEAWKEKQLGSGGVIFDADFLAERGNNLKEFNLILERFCIVLMAGIAAEKIIYGHSKGGKEDRQKLSLALLSLGLSESLCQQKERWSLLQATNLIQEHQSSYQALVEAIKVRKSVEQCYQIISTSVDGC
jgi:hypothetical protein